MSGRRAGRRTSAWVTDAAIADGTAYAGTLNGVFRSVDRGSTWQSSGLKGQWITQVVGRSGAGAVYALASRRPHSRDPGRRGDVDEHPVERDLRGRRSGRSVERVCRNVRRSDREVGRLRVELERAYEAVRRSLHRGDRVRHAGDLRPHVRGTSSEARRRRLLDSRPGARGRRIFGGTGALYSVAGNSFCRTADSAQRGPAATRSGAYLLRVVEIPSDVPGAASSPVGVFGSGAALERRFRRDVGASSAANWDTTTSIQGLAVDAASGLILAGDDRRMFRSQDLGASWVPANTGLQSTWIRALALDPSNPSNLWAGASGYGTGSPGLFFHSDRLRFLLVADGSDSPPTVESDRPRSFGRLHDPDGSRRQVYRSEDGGTTWNSWTGSQYALYALAIDPESPDRVFAAAGEGLKRSEDGGRTWSTSLAVAQAVYSVLFDQRRPERIYAGSFYDYSYSYYGYYSYPQGGSIFVSVDRGSTFTQSEDIGAAVYSIAQDPFRENVLFAGTGAGVSSSVDGGTHWRHMSSGLAGSYVSALAADPARPGHMYAATEKGVFRTVDGAHSWEPFSAGVASADRLEPRDLAGRKASPCRDCRQRRLRHRPPRASRLPLCPELHASVPRRKSIRRGSRGRAQARDAIRPGRGALSGRPSRLFRAADGHRRPGSARRSSSRCSARERSGNPVRPSSTRV